MSREPSFETPSIGLRLGARPQSNGSCRFRVWAPRVESVDVRLVSPGERLVPMTRVERGYFEAHVPDVAAGARYWYRLNGEVDRPDPASRFQPEGVHGPSEVIDPEAFDWSDRAWFGHALDDYVIYELHVGTFTEDGTFDAIIPKLDDLRDLGVTVIELMPVAQFPGARNWGYDGVDLFAVQDSYGGPDGLRRLVDACHRRGLGVALDVVYNHLGPEGNYLRDFGPYFTDHYRTPWGDAINFDGAGSDEVRAFFIENGLHWLLEYHIDAFRLDAVHAMFDQSAIHFLEAFTSAMHDAAASVGRRVTVIAESDLNDPRLIRGRDLGGYGMDGQWADDVHHALHVLLTGERDGYYGDYAGHADLAVAMRQGYVYTGQRSAYRGHRHGRPHGLRDGRRFIVCSQNHDQVGNRATGDRLSTNLDLDQLKLAAAVVLLSPFTPMLFMGEEYGETSPFQYFVSHGDPDLVEAVRAGRRREFAAFEWHGEVPDPQAETTFARSTLQHGLRELPPNREICAFYRELLRLRRVVPALRSHDLGAQSVSAALDANAIVVERRSGDDSVLIVYNFAAEPVHVRHRVDNGRWHCLLDSRDKRWGGRGEPAEDLIVTNHIADLTVDGRSLLVFAHHSIEEH
jgi:maltooligosyltrehalose trehalohydrolase